MCQGVCRPADTMVHKDTQVARKTVAADECLTAALQVLFKQAKLRNAPFEWVYDGLAPALLPQVLARSKGMPLALALVAAAVARRLGVRMRLLCAPEAIQASTASGGDTDRGLFCAVHRLGRGVAPHIGVTTSNSITTPAG